MNPSLIQFTLGCLLILGFLVHVLAQRSGLPRVTLLLLIGVFIGPVLQIVPVEFEQYFPAIAQFALSIVGFMLGEEFLGSKLKKLGSLILSVAVFETLLAAICVFIALYLVGTPLVLALLLSAIAPASAPAATIDVIRESKSSGELSDTVLGVVAIDDMFGVLLFSFLIVLAGLIEAGSLDFMHLYNAIREIIVGVLVGVLFAFPMVVFSGRAYPGKLTVVETLGCVMACAGLARLLEGSYLIACIALGAVVANKARHHSRPFHAIKGVGEPFLISFFILSGFEFDISILYSLSTVFVAYVFSRSLGLILGGGLGARIVSAPEKIRRNVGWCLLPQAGVAMGLGLVSAERFPQYSATIMSLLVCSTLFFELLGPILTKRALKRAGEIS